MTTTTPPPPPQENPHESQETQEELILALRKELENLAKELHELAFRRAEGLLEKGAIPPASFLKNWTASSALPLNAFSSLFQHPKKWVNSVLKSDFLDLDTWRGVWYLLEAKREAQKLRKAGEYVTDEYGLDEEFFDKCRPFFTFLYKYYWRVETVGISNVPDEGGALLVCNHSGVLPWDGAMVNVAIWEEHPHPRHVRTLFLRWFKSLPFIAPILARTGAVLACPENAERLLKQKQLTAVFPEGLKGIGKLYKDRYHLARFGRGGFIKIAIHGQAPYYPRLYYWCRRNPSESDAPEFFK
jgi:hypothetical protein